MFYTRNRICSNLLVLRVKILENGTIILIIGCIMLIGEIHFVVLGKRR